MATTILTNLLEQLETEAALTEQLAPEVLTEQQWTEPVTFDELFEELGI